MLIYVLPISGGAFPTQLSLMLSVGKTPDLMLGASGGNVSAYLYLASGGDETKARDIVKHMKKDMFIRGTEFQAFFNGHFQRGTGVDALFNNIFTKESIVSSEIVTLVCDQNQIAPKIFSNRTKDTSFFDEELTDMDYLLYQLKRVEHLDGNVSNIATVSLASASIPGVAAPQSYNGDDYVDGGVCFASPLTPLSGYIADKLKTVKSPLQMIYFCCYDMNLISEMKSSIVSGLGLFFKNATKRMLEISHFNAIQDRARAVEMMVELANLKYCKVQNATSEITLKDKLERLSNQDYVMVIYPHGYPEINILNFQADDILRVMDDAKNFSYYVWTKEC